MSYQATLDRIVDEVRPLLKEGAVASYIPALARVPKEQFAIALRTVDGEEAWAGSADVPFSIQSISKVLTLTLGMRTVGASLFDRIGREPSGDPFNSLVQLEREQGVPRNPLINSGAIAVADRLVTALSMPKEELLDFVTDLVGEPVFYDLEVAESEAATGFRNIAMAYFMKSLWRVVCLHCATRALR